VDLRVDEGSRPTLRRAAARDAQRLLRLLVRLQLLGPDIVSRGPCPQGLRVFKALPCIPWGEKGRGRSAGSAQRAAAKSAQCVHTLGFGAAGADRCHVLPFQGPMPPSAACLSACRPATFVRSGLTDAKQPAMQAESAPADRDAPLAESGVIFPRERASSGGTTSRLRSGQSRRRRAAAGWARVRHPAAPTAGRSVRREAARATARCRAQSAGARRAHAPSVMAVTSCSRRAECRSTVRARARAPSPTLDASP
jgi:hypothetical protein